MSIKGIVVELYKAQKKVHDLQDKLESAHISEKDRIRFELKQAEVECAQLRRILEGAKESSSLAPHSQRRKF